MAKKKKLDDLEAELAALDAELAALEGRAAAPAPKPKPAAKPSEPVAEPAEEAPAKKRAGLSFGRKTKAPASDVPAVEPAAEPAASKLKLPSFGRKKSDAAPEAAPVASAPVQAAMPAALPMRAALPQGDLTHWRQEGATWVRAVPGFEGPVLRRILDEEGATVREEDATRADLDEVRGVKAERGVGKLLGGTASRFKSFKFGRKGGDE